VSGQAELDPPMPGADTCFCIRFTAGGFSGTRLSQGFDSLTSQINSNYPLAIRTISSADIHQLLRDPALIDLSSASSVGASRRLRRTLQIVFG
jgi:hypothetical protein